VFVEEMLGWERWKEASVLGRVVVVHGELEWREADGKPYYFVKKASWELAPGSKLLALELPEEEEDTPKDEESVPKRKAANPSPPLPAGGVESGPKAS
jgi:hypothetical protein